jgi:hypothetical protein
MLMHLTKEHVNGEPTICNQQYLVLLYRQQHSAPHTIMVGNLKHTWHDITAASTDSKPYHQKPENTHIFVTTDF